MPTISKILIEFATILPLLHALAFWLQGMWDPSSPTRARTLTLTLEGEVPNIGPPGKSQNFGFDGLAQWGGLRSKPKRRSLIGDPLPINLGPQRAQSKGEWSISKISPSSTEDYRENGLGTELGWGMAKGGKLVPKNTAPSYVGLMGICRQACPQKSWIQDTASSVKYSFEKNFWI